MNTSKSMAKNTSGLMVVIPILIILFPIAYSLFTFSSAKSNDTPTVFLERPDPIYKKCVRDTDYMRHHHWELLRAVREEIVRYGKRGDLSLSKCRECHTSRERFCKRCHDAVSMTPDCYGCHYYP